MDKNKNQNKLPIFESFDNRTECEKAWEGMPEYISNDLTPYKTILVHFENRQDMKTFSKLINQTILSTTKYIYYPKAKIEIAADKRYINKNES